MKRIKNSKKLTAVLLSAAILTSVPVSQAHAAKIEDEPLAVTPMAGTRTVLHMTDNTQKEYDGYILASAIENNAIASSVASYEVICGGETVLSVELNDIRGGGSSVAASKKMNGYYAITFDLGENEEGFLTGLDGARVDEIETKMLASLHSGEGFTVTDVGFIDAEKTGVEDYDSLLCWAGATSNILAYTGWAEYAGFGDEDDLFDLYANSFVDDGNTSAGGASWFFNGVGVNDEFGDDMLKSDHFGEYATDYAYDMVAPVYSFGSDRCKYAAILIESLKNGCGVLLGGAFLRYGAPVGGHAVSCWGYVVDNSFSENVEDHYKMFFISDSDSDLTGDQDRRTAPNCLLATTASPYWEDMYGSQLWLFHDYEDYLPMEFVAVKPYSESLEKETSPKATKSMRGSPDLIPSGIEVSNSAEWEQGTQVARSDENVNLKVFVQNNGIAAFSGNLHVEFSVRSKEGDTVRDVDFAQQYEMGFGECGEVCCGLGVLSEGEYTVDVSVVPDDSVDEAYYYNNHGSFAFSILNKSELATPALTFKVAEDCGVSKDSHLNKLIHRFLLEIDGFTDAENQFASASFDVLYSRSGVNGEEIWEHENVFSYWWSDESYPEKVGYYFDFNAGYTKVMVKAFVRTQNNIVFEMEPLVIEYSNPHRLVEPKIDPEKLSVKVEMTGFGKFKDGTPAVKIRATITGFPYETLFTYNLNNSVKTVARSANVYDKKTKEWSGWLVLASGPYEYGLSLDGAIVVEDLIEADTYKMKMRYEVNCPNHITYTIKSDKIDVSAFVASRKLNVSRCEDSQESFAPIYNTDKTFHMNESARLRFTNPDDTPYSGTYQVIAKSYVTGDFALTEPIECTIEPNGTLETPEIGSFITALPCGMYFLSAKFEGASAITDSDTGCFDVGALLGDANLDGKTNIRDITAIQRYLAEYQDFNPYQLDAADVDIDGYVTIDDVTRIQRCLAEYEELYIDEDDD